MTRARDGWTASALGLAMLALYNANGRDIGTYDSQPTKFAAAVDPPPHSRRPHTLRVVLWSAAIGLALGVAAAAILVPVGAANVRGVGTALGATPILEGLHESIHFSVWTRDAVRTPLL